jgi:hypothetical protein
MILNVEIIGLLDKLFLEAWVLYDYKALRFGELLAERI